MRYTHLFLLLLLTTPGVYAQKATLYVDRTPIDSVESRYAIVRMINVGTGTYKLLFNYGQLPETGAFRTRYQPNIYQKGILKHEVRPFMVSNRVEALEVLYANGWKLLHYNQLASDGEAARADNRYEFILEKVTP